MTSTRKKRQKEQFERSCKCKDHETILEKYKEEPHQVFTVGSKDYSRRAYNNLVTNSSLTSRCKYVCDICLKYALDSRNKENDNVDSCNKVLSDDNNEKTSNELANELEESVITSIDELLKKPEQTKNLKRSEKLNGGADLGPI